MDTKKVLSNSSKDIDILGRMPANWAPYHGHSFRICITLPERYPFNPPLCKFIDIPYHPNIKDDGRVCIPLLDQHRSYKSLLSLVDIIKEIVNVLQNFDSKLVINAEAARLYVEDRAKFDQKALEVAKRFLN